MGITYENVRASSSHTGAQIDLSPDLDGSITVTISKNGTISKTATAVAFGNVATASDTF